MILEQGKCGGHHDEHHDEGAHPANLALLVHVLHDIALEQVKREGGRRVDDETRKRRHGGREHKHNHDADEHIGQGREHRGDDGVVHRRAVCLILDGISVKPTKTAQEIAATRDDKREDRRDDGALLDGRAVLDGIELLHHLRQAPGAQRREDDDTEKVGRIGTEHRGEDALEVRAAIYLGKRGHGLHEAAVIAQDGRDDGDDAHKHDDALEKVVHNRGHVAADHNIHAGDKRHGDDAHLIGQAECHTEQARQAVVDACGIRDKEDEDDGGRSHAQGLGTIPLAEELRHGLRIEAVRHLTGTRTHDPPGKKAAEQRVADARPKRREAVLPAKLAGIADENDRREVARTIGERAEPRAHVATAENEAVNTRGRTATIDAHPDCHAEEYQDETDLCDHDAHPKLALPIVTTAMYHCLRLCQHIL